MTHTDHKKPAGNFSQIRDHVINQLLTGLPVQLTYHNISHTEDVVEQVQRIAAAEGITNEEELYLLKIAALYHDSGFLFIYTGHEEKSCGLCRKELPGFGLDPAQIEKICGIIMATKIPQSPGNKLQQIICDADLDYLGRDDFDAISNNLYREFLTYGFVRDRTEWLQKQISFLEPHRYFTKSSRQLRQPKKWVQVLKLKALLEAGN